MLAVGYGFKWISVAGTAPQLDFHEDERLGPPLQNQMTSEVRFHAKLAEYDVERLEVALAAADYDQIATLFNTKVRDAYGATECPFLSYGCEYGWYHVNSDWVVVEPVDADYQPIPPGEHSHTVLLSNLANRVQPILRYDLGDSILERPDPCPCGNPLLAIRVQGCSADVLTFPTEREEEVTIAPLVFGTLIDRTPGVELFQIVQSTPTSVRVRLRPKSGSDPDVVWQAVHTGIAHLLSEHGLDHVRVERAEEPPQQSPGGKYRTIIPLN